MTQATEQDRVRPIERPLAPLVLPELALKIALGAKLARKDGESLVFFEGDTLRVHDDDFAISARAAKRLRAKLPAKLEQLSVGDLITLAGHARQYVVDELFRPDAVRVLYYPSLAKASAFYRCMVPSLALNTGDRVIAHLSSKKIAREALEYDVVVIQIDHSPATIKFAKGLQSLGKKVVYEIDDAYDALEPWHLCYERYSRPDAQEQVRRMMSEVDCVTVTTDHLAARCRPHAKRVEVVPNLIPLWDWPKADPHGTGEFRILWGGSPSHAGDLAAVTDTLFRFTRNHEDVRLVFIGREPEIVPDDLRSRVILHDFCDFEEYPNRLADCKADVAIAPLADIEFNRSKSNLKLLEYGAAGYPVIASDVGPYKGSAACLCKTEEDWMNSLSALRENAFLRKQVASRCLEFSRAYEMETGRGKLEGFFVSLVG